MRYFFLFLSISFHLFAQYEVSICTIFKNEAPFLKEWIEFHKLQGVEHFYLYNNGSTDRSLEVLKPYINKNVVTLINWNFANEKGDHDSWRAIQCGAYLNCMINYAKETKWLAVLDSDEFLFCVKGELLPDFLKKYEQYGGLAVNWLCFGTSGVKNIPKDKLMIEMLTRCASRKLSDNRYIKTIFQTKYVSFDQYMIKPTCDHNFQYVYGKHTVDVHFQKVVGLKTRHPSIDTIRINHYWTRTEDFFQNQKLKRKPEAKVNQLLHTAKHYNQSEDKAILKFVPLLREIMFPSQKITK